MGQVTLVLTLVLVASHVQGGDDAKGTGCYDCNFAPSGFVKGPGDWAQGSAEVGYMRCGLVTRTDRYFVHKDRCLSGRCYIRQEENGMVYRGCADSDKLPWNITSAVNCHYQGSRKALWWFCDGNKCNTGQIGENSDRCGGPPAHTSNTPGHHVTYDPRHTSRDVPTARQQHGILGNTYDQGILGNRDVYGQSSGHGRYAGSGGYGGYGVGRKYNDLVGSFWPYPWQAYTNEGYSAENAVEGKRARLWKESYTVQKEYNPCDRNCYNNPSGLFADPDRPNYFIQCGCDFQHGRPCTCCRKFYVPCAPGSVFDDVKKVCVNRHS